MSSVDVTAALTLAITGEAHLYGKRPRRATPVPAGLQDLAAVRGSDELLLWLLRRPEATAAVRAEAHRRAFTPGLWGWEHRSLRAALVAAGGLSEAELLTVLTQDGDRLGALLSGPDRARVLALLPRALDALEPRLLPTLADDPDTAPLLAARLPQLLAREAEDDTSTGLRRLVLGDPTSPLALATVAAASLADPADLDPDAGAEHPPLGYRPARPGDPVWLCRPPYHEHRDSPIHWLRVLLGVGEAVREPSEPPYRLDAAALTARLDAPALLEAARAPWLAALLLAAGTPLTADQQRLAHTLLVTDPAARFATRLPGAAGARQLAATLGLLRLAVTHREVRAAVDPGLRAELDQAYTAAVAAVLALTGPASRWPGQLERSRPRAAPEEPYWLTRTEGWVAWLAALAALAPAGADGLAAACAAELAILVTAGDPRVSGALGPDGEALLTALATGLAADPGTAGTDRAVLLDRWPGALSAAAVALDDALAARVREQAREEGDPALLGALPDGPALLAELVTARLAGPRRGLNADLRRLLASPALTEPVLRLVPLHALAATSTPIEVDRLLTALVARAAGQDPDRWVLAGTAPAPGMTVGEFLDAVTAGTSPAVPARPAAPAPRPARRAPARPATPAPPLRGAAAERRRRRRGPEKPRCRDTRTDGSPCRGYRAAGQEYCSFHLQQRAGQGG